MNGDLDCPGEGKCHGCMSWCDKCGDVDCICDFPDCDVHVRLEEAEAEARQTLNETRALRQALASAESYHQVNLDKIRRIKQFPLGMVPREKKRR